MVNVTAIHETEGFVGDGLNQVVAFRPQLVGVLGGVNEALLMSQFLWLSECRADEDGWFERSIEALQADVGLSRFQQKQARERLKRVGVLEERYRGIPRHVEFRVNQKMLNDLITGKPKADDLVCEKVTDKPASFSQASVLESDDTVCEKVTDRTVRNSHTVLLESDMQVCEFHSALECEKLALLQYKRLYKDSKDKITEPSSDPPQSFNHSSEENPPTAINSDSQKQKSPKKQAHDDMVEALLVLTKGGYGCAYEDLDLSMMTKKEWSIYHKWGKTALERGRSTAELVAFGEWFRVNDWRGPRGEKPTLTVISQRWADFQANITTTGGDDDSGSASSTPYTTAADREWFERSAKAFERLTI